MKQEQLPETEFGWHVGFPASPHERSHQKLYPNAPYVYLKTKVTDQLIADIKDDYINHIDKSKLTTRICEE